MGTPVGRCQAIKMQLDQILAMQDRTLSCYTMLKTKYHRVASVPVMQEEQEAVTVRHQGSGFVPLISLVATRSGEHAVRFLLP